MSHSLSDLLLLYAQQFEDQHAPQNMTIALREAAKELDRLQAGGCARDQSTTQYCAEAAMLAVENERLRAALDITTEGLEWCVIRAEAMPTPDVGAGSFARICLDKARAALKEPRT
jgi:hypothetical protein